jgi:hypothetical protein
VLDFGNKCGQSLTDTSLLGLTPTTVSPYGHPITQA